MTCVSATKGTLYKTVVDDCGNTTTFNLTFNGTDGVQDGTKYECSLQLEADGNNSAKSVPVEVATPLAKSNFKLFNRGSYTSAHVILNLLNEMRNYCFVNIFS